jgi:hypothetical protein
MVHAKPWTRGRTARLQFGLDRVGKADQDEID